MGTQDESDESVLQPPHGLRTWLSRVDTLSAVSVLYITFPNVIFFLGWLKPIYAIAASGLVALGLWRVLQNENGNDGAAVDRRPRWRKALFYATVILLLFLWLSLSGIGGMGFQNSDWKARNTVLRTLMEHPWPALVPMHERQALLVSYLAYYLPAALIGKLVGPYAIAAWPVANIALYLWSFAGVLIAALWLMRHSRHYAVLTVFLFIFYGGWDIVGWVLTHSAPISGTKCIDSWAHSLVLLHYSCMTGQLFWVPHQAIPAWIVVSLVLRDLFSQRTCRNLCFYVAITLLWSPFTALGLAPYTLLIAYKTRLKGALSLQNVAGLPLALIVTLFLTSIDSESIPKGWLWDFYSLPANFTTVFLFYILKFGLYAAFICEILRHDKEWATLRSLWVTVIASLLLIPCYRLGQSNDFCMRVSLPSLFVLLILLISSLRPEFRRSETTRTSSGFLCLALLIGACAPGVEIARCVEASVAAKRVFTPPPLPQKTFRYSQLNKKHPLFGNQYSAKMDTPFMKFLAAKPELPPQDALPFLKGISRLKLTAADGLKIRGFVLSHLGVTRIEILDDETVLGEAAFPVYRADISSQHPQYNDAWSGFGYHNPSLANREEITLKIRVYSADTMLAEILSEKVKRMEGTVDGSVP